MPSESRKFNTWEPLANIGHCTEQLYQFYQSRLKEEEGEGPEEEFEVEQILDHRYSEESLYRVKWVGVAEESWVPESNMTNCPVLLTEFWKERQKELKEGGEDLFLEINFPDEERFKEDVPSKDQLVLPTQWSKIKINSPKRG